MKSVKLLLRRVYCGKNYTIGRLYIDNEYFSDSLEDAVRDLNKNGKFDNGEEKIYGQSAIPYGTYKIILSYSPKFKRILPEILNVPDFTGIRIHRGNYPKDTLGCILVGMNTVKGEVHNSTKYEKLLIEKLKDADDIEIKII